MIPSGSASSGSGPIRPTARGLALLSTFAALVVAAVVTDLPTLEPFAAGVGVPIVVGAAVCRSRRARLGAGPSVHVHAQPAMVAIGERAEVRTTVTAEAVRLPPIAWDAPRWVRLEALPEHAGGLRTLHSYPPEAPHHWLPPARTSLVDTTPGASPATATGAVPVPTGSRGVFTLRPLRWWVHDPFGLYAFGGDPTRAPVVVVYPAPVPLPPGGSGPAGRDPDASATGRPSLRNDLGDVGELTGLRPYRQGDRLRSIHWPSRSGPGPLMVREFAPDDRRVVRVVLDDRAGVHRRSDYDAVLSVTHGLLAEAGAAGWTAELVTLCGRRWSILPSPEGAAEILPLLAVVNPIRPAAPLPPDLLEAPFTVVTTPTARATLPDRVVRLGRVVTV